MDLLKINSLSRDLPDGQRADFCPLCSPQWDHGPIRADGQAMGGLLRAGFFLPGLLGLGCLLFLTPFADCFAKPAGCFWTDGNPEQLLEDPTRLPKRHPTPELDQMAWLPRRQGAGEEGSFLDLGGKKLSPHLGQVP